MTTRRTFICNLCGTPITDGKGRGILFSAQGIAWTTTAQAENHLCDNCTSALQTAFQEKRS